MPELTTDATTRLLTAARRWRAEVQPNWPGNMPEHERELALAIDELNGKREDDDDDSR
jgi:hypothetical protein